MMMMMMMMMMKAMMMMMMVKMKGLWKCCHGVIQGLEECVVVVLVCILRLVLPSRASENRHSHGISEPS